MDEQTSLRIVPWFSIDGLLKLRRRSALVISSPKHSCEQNITRTMDFSDITEKSNFTEDIDSFVR